MTMSPKSAPSTAVTDAPKIVLDQSPGSENWSVTLDCGGTIKLRTFELASNLRFRRAALFQAGRSFPPMNSEAWLEVIGGALQSLRQRRQK